MAPVERAISLYLQRQKKKKKFHRTLGGFKYSENDQPISLLLLKGTSVGVDYKQL